VTEAFRLLNKSIIRVEQPDVHLDQDDAEEMEVDQPEAERPEGEDGEEAAPPAAPKQKLTLSFEAYKNLSNLLVFHMRHEEEKVEEGDSTSKGVRRSEVVAWYLDQISERFETEEEILEAKTLVEKVIDRLIYHDQVVIPLMKTGLAGDEESEEDDPYLVVHPNYIVDM